MSKECNNQGRAYEYIFINALKEKVCTRRKAEILENSAFVADKNAYAVIGNKLKETLLKSANSAIDVIFDMEPMLVEDDGEILCLSVQTDSHGESGDVRDIVLSLLNKQWEIGLSIKHNHFAVKHSRLAKDLDFGDKWFDVPCSVEYWNDVKPIFTNLDKMKSMQKEWGEITSKYDDVYVPLLSAFVKEVLRSNSLCSDLPKRMVEYLLGRFDFYKVISVDNMQLTRIQSFNFHGQLNQNLKRIKPKIVVPLSEYPTRIVDFCFKPESKTTLELYMDKGWQFSFRLHNASSKVETSLKFDIQIVGMPTTIMIIDCFWK